jgi:hypothetical protein
MKLQAKISVGISVLGCLYILRLANREQQEVRGLGLESDSISFELEQKGRGNTHAPMPSTAEVKPLNASPEEILKSVLPEIESDLEPMAREILLSSFKFTSAVELLKRESGIQGLLDGYLNKMFRNDMAIARAHDSRLTAELSMKSESRLIGFYQSDGFWEQREEGALLSPRPRDFGRP